MRRFRKFLDWKFVVSLALVFAAVTGTPEKTYSQDCNDSSCVQITGTITADDAYALYYGNEEGITLLGYNGDWKNSEAYNFSAKPTDYIFVVAADTHDAEGLLAEFSGNGNVVSTGNPAWEAFLTDIGLGTLAPIAASAASQALTGIIGSIGGMFGMQTASSPIDVFPQINNIILSEIKDADNNNLWAAPTVGGENGVGWKYFPDMSNTAKWIWQNTAECSDLPFDEDCENDDFRCFIFRLPVSALTVKSEENPLTCSCVTGSLDASYSFDDFSDLSQFTLNRSIPAVSNGQDVLRLSNSDIGAGSAFLSEPVVLKDNSSFSTSFSFQITDPSGSSEDADGRGADGFVFVIQAVSDKIVGGAGGDIGYSGISQSVGIEFDTYYNSDRDDDGNHVGINFNGNMSSAVRRNVTSRMNNGDVWYSWIDYSRSNNLMEVRLSQTSVRPDEAFLSYTVDLSSILGSPNVYAGFTSGTWGGTGNHDIRSWIFDTCISDMFEAGTFTVGKTGTVKTDWLYDGGMYEGELGIFSLAGMESLEPNSQEFITEAVKRVLSNSEKGYIVLSDKSEGARFKGPLGSSTEPERNFGIYKGQKSFEMTPGDTFATLLVPDSTFAAISGNPATVPIFSLATSNPDHEMYFGQMAKIEDIGNAFVFEDMAVSGSDRDYNDLIVQITGVTVFAPTLDNPELAFKEDWRKSQNPVIPHIEVSPPDSDTLWMTVTLKSPADLFVYDPQGNVIGKEGGTIPGATFERDADGHQIVSLPKLDSGEYRVVLRAVGDGGLCHLEIKGYQGNAELVSEEKPFVIGAHQTFTTMISADDFFDSTTVAFSVPDISEDGAGNPLAYDFDGNGKIDDNDIQRLTSLWGKKCGEAEYDPFFDLDNDCSITVKDIMTVAGSGGNR